MGIGLLHGFGVGKHLVIRHVKGYRTESVSVNCIQRAII
jgi:hypothetical protein